MSCLRETTIIIDQNRGSELFPDSLEHLHLDIIDKADVESDIKFPFLVVVMISAAQTIHELLGVGRS